MLSAFPSRAFPIPRFYLLERTEFSSWLLQIGRRLAVLRGRQPACLYAWRGSWLIDRLLQFQYRRAKDTPPTGRDWMSRLPVDGGYPAERLESVTAATVTFPTSKQADAYMTV